jgi:hypothetical protein
MFALVNAAVAGPVAGPFLYFTYKHIQEPFYLLILFGLVMILNWVTIWDTYEYFVYEYRKQTHNTEGLQKDNEHAGQGGIIQAVRGQDRTLNYMKKCREGVLSPMLP